MATMATMVHDSNALTSDATSEVNSDENVTTEENVIPEDTKTPDPPKDTETLDLRNIKKPYASGKTIDQSFVFDQKLAEKTFDTYSIAASLIPLSISLILWVYTRDWEAPQNAHDWMVFVIVRRLVWNVIVGFGHYVPSQRSYKALESYSILKMISIIFAMYMDKGELYWPVVINMLI